MDTRTRMCKSPRPATIRETAAEVRASLCAHEKDTPPRLATIREAAAEVPASSRAELPSEDRCACSLPYAHGQFALRLWHTKAVAWKLGAGSLFRLCAHLLHAKAAA